MGQKDPGSGGWELAAGPRQERMSKQGSREQAVTEGAGPV